MRGKDPLAVYAIERLLGGLRARGCSKRGPNLGKVREIRVAQDQTDVGVGDQPTLPVDDINLPTVGDPDLRHDIPDEPEINLGHADACVATRTSERNRHVGLGLLAKVDRAVVGPVGHSLDKGGFPGAVGMAGDDVHRLARNSDLLAAGRVNQGKLGDGRNLAQEPKRL